MLNLDPAPKTRPKLVPIGRILTTAPSSKTLTSGERSMTNITTCLVTSSTKLGSETSLIFGSLVRTDIGSMNMAVRS